MQGSSLGKGLLAGLGAGMAASAVMNVFQRAVTRRLAGFERPHGAQGVKPDPRDPRGDPTTRAAHELAPGAVSNRNEHQAGTLVHYAFGSAIGGLYGAAAEVVPAVTAGAGLPFGTAFWASADVLAVPALGLSPPAKRIEGWKHAYSLASHLVYGLTAEMVRRAVRAPLGGKGGDSCRGRLQRG